jgi:hypothetical protein
MIRSLLNKKMAITLGILVPFIALSTVMAQFFQRGGGRYRNRDWTNIDRGDVPRWDVDAKFTKELFTFARVRYSSYGRGGWAVDFPDSDLNFSLRLQQLTSMKVNPDPVVVELTDPKLFDYPFLYMIEPGSLYFSNEEVAALRRYCLNGGFMMVDDFWGDDEYENFAAEIKRVFPDREIIDVPLEHEIFHCVYNLNEKPQVPSIHAAQAGREYGMTWEQRWGTPTDRANYRAIVDDAGRIMVFICHNTDLGDGWEREGENSWYFEEFSVKKAYPMGINIVTYAMTH